MKNTITVYHRDKGAAELFLIDARDAVAKHPNEWSEKPWTDAAAKAARDADDAARKRAAEDAGKGKDRVGDDVDHAEPMRFPPPKPLTPADQGLAPGILPVQAGISPMHEGAQPAVPNSDFGGNRPVGSVIDATRPDTNVPLAAADQGPRPNPQNDAPDDAVAKAKAEADAARD